MALIPIRVEDLPLFLKHDFFEFPGGGSYRYRECIYCGAVFDMPEAADERCRKREAYMQLDGDPDLSMGTH